jgi:hypothetical protein
VPHVVIKPHPWRRLKNASSERTVPLVGASLWAAQRVHEAAVQGQRFAFPRYTDDKECRATAASAALVGWVRRIPIDRILHELPHTMAAPRGAVPEGNSVRHRRAAAKPACGDRIPGREQAVNRPRWLPGPAYILASAPTQGVPAMQLTW